MNKKNDSRYQESIKTRAAMRKAWRENIAKGFVSAQNAMRLVKEEAWPRCYGSMLNDQEIRLERRELIK